ncbi:hypothetical protein TNCV_4791261 [Trichonephila clavipes]|nr:hypothetical protein TNCV_4791261 [Trichonephila clavipes]
MSFRLQMVYSMPFRSWDQTSWHIVSKHQWSRTKSRRTGADLLLAPMRGDRGRKSEPLSPKNLGRGALPIGEGRRAGIGGTTAGTHELKIELELFYREKL